MKSSLPKVLHPLLGRTLLGHVLDAAEQAAGQAAGADQHPLVVVGHGADQVRAHLAEIAPAAQAVVQAKQRGTGHAVRVALEAAPEATGTVVVLNGDIPLLRAHTVRTLVESHEAAGAVATLLT